ncbi:MAG: LysR family transcriptional regulator [Pseudomonadota bacterium]
MDWNDLKAFEAIAHAGSLTEAARTSGMSIATLSRRLDHLEETLELKLVMRSSVGIELTQNGKALFISTNQAQNAVGNVCRLAAALKAGEADMPVRISATETVITTLLSPNLSDLFRDDASTSVDFIVSNENVNLSKREADLAIRLASPVQETLITKRLATITTSLYASKDYFSDNQPSVDTMKNQRFVLYDDHFGDIPEVLWAREHGFPGRASMQSSSTLAMLEAVKQGIGVGLLPDFLARKHDLKRVDFPTPPARSLWLVLHRDVRKEPKVVKVRNWITESVRVGVSN